MKHFGCFLIAAAALLTSAAATDNGFSAAFPCAAKQTTQTVQAGTFNLPVTTRNCESSGGVFYLVESSYPQGFIAKKTLKGAFADAVGGAAASVKGTIRSDAPFNQNGVAGHDAVIDVKAQKAAVRLRVFFVGDKQYQAMVITPAGQENGKAASDFLNSLKLGK